ncbi:MAG: sugar phosphate isomerase/epimerase [Glaciecola sp.]|jgi:sugar phosphate isomerase/epimerase
MAGAGLDRSICHHTGALSHPFPPTTVTKPGIPNEYSLSTSCFGTRLATIEAQVFASIAMGFRRIELGLNEVPVPLAGLEDCGRETGVSFNSLVAGCLNPRSENMSGTKLGSLDAELRERAVLSCRRHIQLATKYGCPTVILRGCEIEHPELRSRAAKLQTDLEENGPDDVLNEAVQTFVVDTQKQSQAQIEHLCRSIHSLRQEYPDVRLAVEPGRTFIDLLNFEAMEWVLDDLPRHDLHYWHDTGAVHRRQRVGLAGQGDWLEKFGSRMLGIHLQDALDNEADLPPGMGAVDFKLVSEYTPGEAEKVVDIGAHHGRSEVLAAVRFLLDRGF